MSLSLRVVVWGQGEAQDLEQLVDSDTLEHVSKLGLG